MQPLVAGDCLPSVKTVHALAATIPHYPFGLSKVVGLYQSEPACGNTGLPLPPQAYMPCRRIGRYYISSALLCRTGVAAP